MAVAYNDIKRSIAILLNTGDKSTNQFSTSISMVPSILRDQSPDSFNPRVVSIGPLHHGEENLKEIEGLKSSYMHSLLSRRCLPDPGNQSLEACLTWVNASIKEIRACYAGIRTYDDPELARMMVMDACFILEFIYNWKEGTLNTLFRFSIFKDLLLVENQIPFFVLNKIFDILKTDSRDSIIDYILPVIRYGYFSLYRHESIDRNACAHSTNHVHILGLLQKCCQPADPIPSHSEVPESFKIHSVTELDKAGVSFEPYTDASWPMDIKFGHLPRFALFTRFWCKPTLKMPVLYINDMTELVLRNLIAFEQKSKAPRHVSSYATTIDMLVNSQEDIAKLVESRIVYNIMGSNEEALNMVNTICKNVPADYSVYFHELKQLDTYYNGYWPRHIARLRRTYFNSPWSMIALLAGIILFALTIAQTILTAVQTHFTIHPKK